MWRRTTRVTLLLAWLVFLGLLAYFGTHPRLIAPLAARLVTRNLFPGRQGSIRLRDFQGSLTSGVALRQVSLSLAGEGGSAVLVTVDTLTLDYRLKELLAKPPRLRAVLAQGLKIHAVPAPPGARRGGVPLGLPPVTIDQLVLSGSLEVAGPTGRLRERIPSLFVRAGVRADSAGVTEVDLRRLDVDWTTRASRIEGAVGALRADRSGVEITGLRLGLDGHPVAIDGRRGWDGRLRLRVDARGVSIPEVERLLATRIGVKAEGDVAAEISARPDSVSFDGTFSGTLEGYRLERLRGRGLATRHTVEWSYLAGRINDAQFAGTGRFDVSDPHRPAFTIEGDVADVDLSKGFVPRVKLPPTAGHGWLRIDRRGEIDRTTVTGWLADGHLAAVPFDTCRVDVQAQHGTASLRMIDLRYRSEVGRLSGTADTTGSFDGRLELTAGDLADLPPQLRWPRLGGSLRAAGAVRGRDPVYRFEGQGTLHGFSLAALRADSCAVTVAVDDLLGSPRVSGEAGGSGLAVGALRLGDFALSGSASRTGAVIETFRAARGGSTVTLHGQAAVADSTADIRIDRLQVELEGTRWQTAAPIDVHTGPRALRVDEFALTSEFGSVHASGAYDRRAERLSGACRFQRFDLRLLAPYVQRGSLLNGEVSARIDLSGTPSAPELTVTADLVHGQFSKANVDSLHVTARYASGELGIDRLDLRSNYGRLTARGSVANAAARKPSEFWPGAALDLQVDVQQADWAFVDQFRIPALKRIKGAFAGTFHVAGTSRAPLVDGHITSEPFNVHWLHLQRLTGRLGLTPTRLTLSDLVGVQQKMTITGRIEVPLRADFLSAPGTPLDGPFTMELHVADGTDIAPLAAATNAFHSASGTGGMDLTVAGPLRHPLFHGSLRIRGGGCVLKGLEEVYHDVSATGTWEGDELVLRDIQGGEGARGTFSGSATLRFLGLMLTGFSVDLKADRFLVASIPDLRALVRSDAVRLTGVKVGPDSVMVPKFTGRLQIIEARYTGDFSEKPAVTDVRAATVAPDWLADLHLVGPPRTTLISNRAMELAMSGDVDLVRDLSGLYLSGTMDIDGGRLPVFNNDFQVVQGRLTFNREVGLFPLVDLTAETTVRLPYEGPYTNRTLEKITATVSGTIDRPSVDLVSENGYSRTNIERMLLGFSPRTADQLTAQEVYGTSIAAGFNLLEREIASELKVVDTFDINSSLNPGTGTQNYQLGVGKYLGQDLYVKYAQGLSEPDRDLLIEYQISDHLLLQSEVSRQMQIEQASTLYNLDLKYRFEY